MSTRAYVSCGYGSVSGSSLNLTCASVGLQNGFPEEWLSNTFAVMTFGNGVVAIVSGVVASGVRSQQCKRCWRVCVALKF